MAKKRKEKKSGKLGLSWGSIWEKDEDEDVDDDDDDGHGKSHSAASL